METTNQNALAQQRRGRKIFILMAIFFTVPIFVVIAMIKYDWRPSGQSYGELVKPARLIVHTENLKDNHGKSQAKFWGDKWNMVFVAEVCESVCMKKLYDMRQIHVSTYKDIMRVQRVLITQQEDVSTIQSEYPNLIIINQPHNDVEELLGQFNLVNEVAVTSNRIYLVDPLGHVMMSYKPEVEASKMRKDLTRLLKFSWAG